MIPAILLALALAVGGAVISSSVSGGGPSAPQPSSVSGGGPS